MKAVANRSSAPYEPIQAAVDHADPKGLLELVLWIGGLLAVVLVFAVLL